jgi:hypothetical protein
MRRVSSQRDSSHRRRNPPAQLLPWLGFFDKLARADVFVLLDNVQFPRTSKGTWINRVKLLIGGAARWTTVPVVRSQGSSPAIADVRIDDGQRWRTKLARTIELNYRRARAFEDVFPVVAELLETREERIAVFNERNIRRLAEAPQSPNETNALCAFATRSSSRYACSVNWESELPVAPATGSILSSVDSAVQEPKQAVDVDLEPERDGKREPVRDQVDEHDRRLEIDVVAKPTLVTESGEELVTAA